MSSSVLPHYSQIGVVGMTLHPYRVEGEDVAVLYEVKNHVAYITLNRPHRMNAIEYTMADLIQEAVAKANADDNVRAIVLQGKGKGFCAGYDLKIYAQSRDLPNPGVQPPTRPWDPTIDFRMMKGNTDKFMSLWHSLKPTICKVHGYAVAGGSDIALCCDIVVMEEEAMIGYPPARVWGSPTTQMWVYRLGAEKAKRMLLTGDLISGKQAQEMGLVSYAVPFAQLDQTVDNLVRRIASVPTNQLIMNKLVVNQAYENMGLKTTQILATLFDGIARHSPEGHYFKQRAEEVGFKQAVKERDSGEIIKVPVNYTFEAKL